MNFPNFFIIFAPPHHIKLAATLFLSFINIFFSFGVVIIKFYQELFLWKSRVSHEISCRHGGDEKLIWFLSELFSSRGGKFLNIENERKSSKKVGKERSEKIEKQSIGNIKAEITSNADLRDLRITSNFCENDEKWRIKIMKRRAFEA